MKASIATLGVLFALVGAMASAGTKTWDGSDSSDWSAIGNWAEGSAPANSDDLVFTSGNPPNQPSNNNVGALSLRSITFVNSTFTGPLTLGGNALTLDTGYGATTTLANNNTTAGRTVTLENDIAIVGSQTWFAANAAGVTVFNGNLTSVGGTTLSFDNASGINTLRLAGDNSGFLGNMNLTVAAATRSITLLHPQAQPAGNMDLGGANGRLYLQGQGASTPYTFGMGAGSGNVNLRDSGSNTGGISGFGAQDIHWRIGGSGNAFWADRLESHDAPVAGERPWIVWGAPGDVLTLNAARTLRAQNNSNPWRIDYTLADGGTSRNLSLENGGLFVLNGGAAQGTLGGTTTISGGALAISNVNQIFNGNLNLNGGVLVLDGVTWSQFAVDRSAGTGANQWQATGGGFAARGADLTISGGDNTDLNANFAIGSAVLDSDGSYYANRAVSVAQGVQLSAARVWKVAGNSTLAGGIYALGSLVHEVSGSISSSVGGTARQLTLNGYGSNTAGIPVLRLSGTNSDLNLVTASDTSTGFGALLIPDVSSLPGTVTIQSSSPGGAGSGWVLLFEGTKTFAKDLIFSFFGTSATVTHGLGAYAGDAVYHGTVSSTGSGANTANLQWHVESGATFTLGSVATPAHFAITRTGQGGSVVNIYRKVGEGTAVLRNVTYADGAASHYLDIREGALRETGSAANDSAQFTHVRLSGGVLETSNARYGAGYYNRTLSTTVSAANLNITAGGGFAAFGGPLTVDLSIAGVRDALQWNTVGFLNNNAVLVFGSLTADNTVEFYDDIKLDQTGTSTRTIRAIDNPDSTADKAVISGAINGGGASYGLEIVGDGTLELTGANTYSSSTTVRGGTLVITGSLNAGTRPVTLLTGGALGGTGTVARNIVVETAGVIAATSATSPTGLQITGTLTVDGLTGLRLPTIAPGTYNVATASGGVTLNSSAVEPLPDGFVGTAWVDGNTLKLKVSGDAAPTVILVR